MWFARRKATTRIPPDGFGEKDIRTESSICTGETTIGFYDPRSGRLLQAVAVRTEGEIADYYRSYGFEPPRRNG